MLVRCVCVFCMLSVHVSVYLCENGIISNFQRDFSMNNFNQIY